MRLAALMLLAACASPPLPRMHSPQPCCAAAGDLARLDGKRVLLDGIYQEGGVRIGDGTVVALEPPPAEDLEGRHVVVTGRLHGGARPRVDGIERIEPQ